ncbi:MAG: DUF3332 family protein [Myxococcota bacterium]
MENRRTRAGGARRIISVVVLSAFLPLVTTGCFGKFELTRKIYNYNKKVDPDKWIQWFAFLALNIIPFYALGVSIDLVLGNSIEFWTGENPINASGRSKRSMLGPEGEVTELTRLADGSLDVRVSRPDGTTQFVNLSRVEDGAVARDADGRVVARVTEADGRTVFLPAHALRDRIESRATRAQASGAHR